MLILISRKKCLFNIYIYTDTHIYKYIYIIRDLILTNIEYNNKENSQWVVFYRPVLLGRLTSGFKQA